MKRMKQHLGSVAGLAVLTLAACADDSSPDESSEEGSLSASLMVALPTHDVTAIRYTVLAPEVPCGGTALASKTVALNGHPLPTEVGAEDGTKHGFGDALFVLAQGDYRICATPLAGGSQSAACSPAESLVYIGQGKNQDLMLVSQCMGSGKGVAGVVTELNDPPELASVTLDPSAFITTCEAVSIAASAEDPNGDPVTLAYTLESGPDGATLRTEGEAAYFFGPAGDYTLRVTATDTHRAESSMTIPLVVTSDVCAVPDAVQEIFAKDCGGCHTVSAAGGLSLANSVVAYDDLVGHVVTGTGCGDRTRVVPGDASSSYLIQKLRGIAGICGVQMPRGRPALSEAQIATIEAWINSLPH